MVSNIKKVSAIIVATFMLLAMSAFFNSNVYAATSYKYDFGEGITVITDKDMNPKGDVLHLPTGKNAVLKIKMNISVDGGATLQHAKI